MIEKINKFIKNNFNYIKVSILILVNVYLVYVFYKFNYNNYIKITNNGWNIIIAYLFSWIIFKIFLYYLV